MSSLYTRIVKIKSNMHSCWSLWCCCSTRILPWMLFLPLWWAIIPFCCGISAMTSLYFWKLRTCSSRYLITIIASTNWASCSGTWLLADGIIASWFGSVSALPNQMWLGVLDVRSIGDRKFSSSPKILSIISPEWLLSYPSENIGFSVLLVATGVLVMLLLIAK